RVGDRPFFIVDTGGFEPVAKDGILHEMAKQTLQAIAEADVIVFMVDVRQGLAPQDRNIAAMLRKTGRQTLLVVNKAEGMNVGVVTAEFHELALGQPYAISAAHGEGVNDLVELALAGFEPDSAEEQIADHPRIAIIGRPNVGKSTLINSLLGENRVIAFDQPGTTRDSIEVPFERNGRSYTLIDTAGLRRRGQVFESLEKFSVIKTLQSVDQANVVVLVLDAQAEISDQDAHIAGHVVEKGRALVVAVNKWDGMDDYARECVKRDLARKLGFLGFARMHFISALQGSGLSALLPSIDEAYRAAMTKLSTPRLTRVLIDAVERQQPPRKGLIRPKLRYAHQGGMNPPLIVIHGNALNAVPESYRRYLEGRFREEFSLQGTPLKVQFKTSTNPYLKKQ
ncbi:MAG: ribosome biogenesis GTPase Der, partial [Burkholderiales bacterium]|nr:ribosome biogenesis GTPase Der [Burkholderiales bacterium]